MKHTTLRLVSVLAILAVALTFIAPSLLAQEDEAATLEEVDARGIKNSAVITWRTDVTTTGKVEYGTDPGSYARSVDDSDDATSHNVRLTGLTVKTTYYYRITATTLEGVESMTSEMSFTTQTNELRFTKVDVVDRTARKAVVRLVTNKNAHTTLYYGTTADALTEVAIPIGISSIGGSDDRLYLLRSLKPNTTYYFQGRANRSEFLAPDNPETAVSGVGLFMTTGIPKFTSISPTKGNANTKLTINGSNFGDDISLSDRLSSVRKFVSIGCSLKVSGHRVTGCLATIQSWTDTKIVVEVGGNAKTGRVYVGKAVIDPPATATEFFFVKGPTFTVKP